MPARWHRRAVRGPGEIIARTASRGGATEGTGTRSRGDVLKLGALGAGALLLAQAGGSAPIAAAARPSAQQDQKILNFALVLERLQAAFYAEALDRTSLGGELREFAETVGEHERQHVEFLEQVLGEAAQPAPRFDLADATRDERSFAETARMLEDAGVAAYNGQAANLTKDALAPAAEIVSVEGRHAAWIRDILGLEPAPDAADAGAESTEIVRQLKTSGLLLG